jgi:tripartite-type tricarboxylate transporter receptor subunit TctC
LNLGVTTARRAETLPDIPTIGEFVLKGMWTFADNRIAVRFAYEWYDDSGS